MNEWQRTGVEAAKKSPNSGRFETNVNAKDWHLISPDGKEFYFHSLNFWLRENCRELFGIEQDEKEIKKIANGFRMAKRATLGKIKKSQRPCCTYKGWEVIPTNDDIK